MYVETANSDMPSPLATLVEMNTVRVGNLETPQLLAASAPDGASFIPNKRAWPVLLQTAPYQHTGQLFYDLVFKRVFDLLFATLFLIALAPLLVIVSLAIWLDTRGSIIYRHRRIGRYGRPFTMYKFCTMIPDRRQGSRSYLGPERRRAHKTIADPRVTRIGKFLRRTSIDELPQLVNVLRGEMSLVGPRPELPEITLRYEPWQHQRHLVRPGITGWWQTHGRSNVMMHLHTDLDLYYIENMSFTLDIRILVRTIGTLCSRTGAF